MSVAFPTGVTPAEGGPAWPDPVPLQEAPAVPPFPVEVLPALLQRFVREGAEALACPADYLAVPLLVLAGAALGTRRSLQIKGQHEQLACLYAAIIGSPGSAKSPALDLAARPVYEQGRRLKDDWDRAVQQYEAELEGYEQDRRAHAPPPAQRWARLQHDWLAVDPFAARGLPPRKGPPGPKPVRPVLERTYVGDITTEALAVVLRENPLGVVMIRDELTAWVGGMNQYKGGRGGDRQFYLAAWSGAPAVVDRKGRHPQGPLLVSRPFLAVVGGLAPRLLARLHPEDDGFFDRLLFAYPPEPPVAAETWQEVSPAALDAWGDTCRRLRELDRATVALGLSADGRAAWEQLTAAHAAECNAEDFPRNLSGPWSKLRVYAARLALLLHHLALVHGETSAAAVEAVSVQRAGRLVDYFKVHARKVHAVLHVDPHAAEATRLLAWIVREQRAQFSRRDAYRALYKDHPGSIDLVLALLQQHGYIRPQPLREMSRSGRPPSPGFQTHPGFQKRDGELPDRAAAARLDPAV